MTDKQKQTIRCAYADLVGAYQAMQQQDYLVHDWKAHLISINEMVEAFPDVITDVVTLENKW